MNTSKGVWRWVLSAWCGVLGVWCAQAGAIRFVGEIKRPHEPAGLSGITHREGNQYLAVDDSGGVVWPLTIPIDTATGRALACTTGMPIRLAGRRDLEGVAWDASLQGVWVSDEGDVSVRGYRLLENCAQVPEVQRVSLPNEQYAARLNLSLESLALAPDGLTLWTCNEEALSAQESAYGGKLGIEDGPRANKTHGTRVRLMRFVRATALAPWRTAGCWVLETDSIGGDKIPFVGRAQSGVSELCVTHDGTLLALEREMSVKAGSLMPSFRCRIYALDCAKATDVTGCATITNTTIRTVRKTLLFTRDTGMTMYEGLCEGPQLDDGSHALLLVSDSDIGDEARIMVLRYWGEAHPKIPPAMPTAFRADISAVRAAARKINPVAFPDADFVVLEDRVHTRYEPDGCDITWEDEWLLIMTEKGRRAQASETLAYSARYGDATFQQVEILGTNGAVRAVNFKDSLRDATDNASMGANIYDPLARKVTCIVSSLAVGEVRHIVTCRRTLKPRMRETWSDVNLLEHTAPIVCARVSVDAPAALPLTCITLRHPCGKPARRLPDVQGDGGRIIHTWVVQDVEQVFPEPSMPPLRTQVQALHLSTIPDWQTVSRWYWELCVPHLALSQSMRLEVAQRTKGLSSRKGKMRVLFDLVSHEVRYMGLTLEDDAPGYEPHDVSLTWANRYGVCRDKAALLVALLREAGLKAFPTLIQAGARIDTDVPLPYFNHAIVACLRADGGYDLMDPTDENAHTFFPSYLSNCSYLVARPEGDVLRVSPIIPVTENRIRVKSEGSLTEDGALALSMCVHFDGVNDNALRTPLAKQTPRQRSETFAKFLKRVSAGAELVSFALSPDDPKDLATPLAVKMTVRFPDALQRGKTRDTLTLPFLTARLSVARALLDENTALEKRRFPLELDTTAGTDETLSIHLADAVGKPLMPQDDTKVGKNGFRFCRSIAVSNGVLTAHRLFDAADVSFDADVYDTLREDLKAVESVEREMPCFAVRALADAHIHTLYDRTYTHLSSPFMWVTTNCIAREILSYRGVKACSELTFSWNPSVEAFHVLLATVSNRTGKVQNISDHEINEMDATWASAASRYPAGRITVVNLPQVEVGSVVRYVVESVTTNAPVAWNAFQNFDSVNPTDEITFTLTCPDEMNVQFSDFTNQPAGTRLQLETGRKGWNWYVSNPPRIPDEPALGASSLWRKCLFVTVGTWQDYGTRLLEAWACAREQGEPDKVRAIAQACTEKCTSPADSIQAIRSFLVHHVRTVGPSLLEIPFAHAFTPPSRVLAEGYGSYADRMNLFLALLEGAGFDCSVMLAADDSHASKAVTQAYQTLARPDLFTSPVIRASYRTGWMPLVGEMETFWLAGENEYAPPQATARASDTYYDPCEDAFGVVPCTDAFTPKTESLMRINIRTDGSADVDVCERTWGAAVGGFRKRWTEMRPEWRTRIHRQLLGALAQNATATSELETDCEGYPATLAFRAWIPDYAVMRDGVAQVTQENLKGAPFVSLSDTLRKAPLFIAGKSPKITRVEVSFPRGYTEIETLPDAFTFVSPMPADNGAIWLTQCVSSRIEGERLIVTVDRMEQRHCARLLSADLASLIREWNKRASSISACRIAVRQNKTLKTEKASR